MQPEWNSMYVHTYMSNKADSSNSDKYIEEETGDRDMTFFLKKILQKLKKHLSCLKNNTCSNFMN